MRMLFHVLGAVLALGLLASCAGPLRVYYQPGAQVAAMQRSLLDCQVTAVQSAPVATQIRREPPRYIPPRRYCDAAGRCRYDGGFWIDGEVYSFDPNANLRERVERQCMADDGYSYVEVPNCSSGVASQVPVAATRVMPQLSPQSCAIRNDDGSWQIVSVAP